jgi:hypothetical protein
VEKVLEQISFVAVVNIFKRDEMKEMSVGVGFG